MASRPLHNNNSYLEGVLSYQDSTCLPEAELAPPCPQHGVDFLIEQIMGGEGHIIPICIGAMTNLATAAWQGAGHFMPALYDPHAVATLLRPELAGWKTGTVRVELQGQHTYGFTRLEENPQGHIRVAWNTEQKQSIGFYLDRILAFDGQ